MSSSTGPRGNTPIGHGRSEGRERRKVESDGVPRRSRKNPLIHRSPNGSKRFVGNQNIAVFRTWSAINGKGEFLEIGQEVLITPARVLTKKLRLAKADCRQFIEKLTASAVKCERRCTWKRIGHSLLDTNWLDHARYSVYVEHVHFDSAVSFSAPMLITNISAPQHGKVKGNCNPPEPLYVPECFARGKWRLALNLNI